MTEHASQHARGVEHATPSRTPPTRIHHVSGGYLHAPPNPRALCHCLLLEDPHGLVLVDTGIGLLDVAHPVERLGREIIEAAGFLFEEADTVYRQIERLGLRPADVTDVVLTHCDPDHVGGLADFPDAKVHVSAEELANASRGNPRYVPSQFAHGPRWRIYRRSARTWFGLEARKVDLGCRSEVLLVWLPGHTHGHCGVAIEQGGRWLLHVGDAYYLRAEVACEGHPVSALASLRADDDLQRRASLEEIRRLVGEHGDLITIVGYHDPSEFPKAGA